MAHLINLKTFTDSRGSLTVIERVIPFEIKHIFYVNGHDYFGNGEDSLQRTKQAVICLKGSCLITSHSGTDEQHFILNTADQCLLLAPDDKHEILQIAEGSILMMLASEPFKQPKLVGELHRCEMED
nr:FdtA/QdtA family cupin domain-containing protein [uncultured Dyadobacter sp.]